MCIARVGRVKAVTRSRAEVEFFDGRSLDGVDVSMVGAKVGSYVEVFGNLALSQLDAAEAKRRKSAWLEVKKAASLPVGV